MTAFKSSLITVKAFMPMLLGDFNMEKHQVRSGVWMDACRWSDCSDEGTCLSSAVPGRIDWLLASRALQHRIVKSHLNWGTGLATHAFQAVDITTGTPSQHLQWVPPEAYPEPLTTSPSAVEAANRRASRTDRSFFRR